MKPSHLLRVILRTRLYATIRHAVASNENDFRIVLLLVLAALLYIKWEERRALIRTEEEEDVARQVRVSDEFGTNSLQVVNGTFYPAIYTRWKERAAVAFNLSVDSTPANNNRCSTAQRDPR